MSAAANIHTAARRFLSERFHELSAAYSALPRQRVGYGYSREAYEIFPRYNVVAAVLVEVERLDPDNLPEAADLYEYLLQSAWSAESILTTKPGLRERHSATTERQFLEHVFQGWRSNGAPDVEPLGYQRVLRDDEVVQIGRKMHERFGVELANGGWDPYRGAAPQGALEVDADDFDRTDTRAVLMKQLASLDQGRLTEVREYGPSYLVDLELFAPEYNGAEGLFTDSEVTWLIYASSYSTVFIHGVFADALKQHLKVRSG